MYKNKFTTLLNDINNLGLDLSSRECPVTVGNLPANNEEIKFTQYDVIFQSIESNFMTYHNSYNSNHLLDGDRMIYNDLHVLLNGFDFNRHKPTTLFKKMKQAAPKKERDFINRLEYDYNLHMMDIINELRVLKEDIKHGDYDHIIYNHNHSIAI